MNVYDCFRILELPRNAGLDELKFAYRSKAKLYHPDRKGGDSRKFNRLHEAYTFLLDYGPFKRGFAGEDFREKTRKANEDALRNAREKARRAEREAARKAEEERRHREAMKARARMMAEERVERERRERLKREAERKAARKREERQKRNNPSHKAHLAGEVLSGRGSDREKLRAIETLVSLKRKSVYPYLKNAFYSESEKVIIAAIHGVAQLRIVQAGPELSSLMCSGSLGIRSAVLEAVASFGKSAPFRGIVDLGLSDRNLTLRIKAGELRESLYG